MGIKKFDHFVNEEKDTKTKYTVTIKRCSYDDFVVEAISEKEAKELALDEAVNTNWASVEAEYDIEEIKK